MALSGHNSPSLVFNSTATASSYSGTLNSVGAGNLVVVCIEACSDSFVNTPSSWTVTLGGETLTYAAGQSASGVFGFTAIFYKIMSGSGNLTLSITTTKACRSMSAHGFVITGHDTTTPIANSGQNDSHSSNALALTSPNGVTTAANNNCIIGCIAVKGGDTTALAVGSADGSSVGESGTNASNDHEWGVAWDETPTAASVTFAWTWSTNSDRPGAAWVEVAAATGGGSPQTITGAAFSDADTFQSGAVTASYTISGAAFSDADSFGSGALATSYTITGSAFTDADIFGSGVVSQGGQIIIGTAFSDGDTFGPGSISTSYAIGGAAFTDTDSFGSGAISTIYTITGAHFTDADTFGSGQVRQITRITGAAFTDTDSFGSGSFSASYTITGVAFADADSFGIGAIVGGVPFGTAGPLNVKTGGIVNSSISGGSIVANDTGGYIVMMRSGGEI